jgi:hypothetical protein
MGFAFDLFFGLIHRPWLDPAISQSSSHFVLAHGGMGGSYAFAGELPLNVQSVDIAHSILVFFV